MTDLERELIQTLKNFIEQYESDKRQQAELIGKLMRQLQESGKQQEEDRKKQTESLDKLTKSVRELSETVRELENAYKDIMNVLEE
jgi:methyl-accepting chemotaxis protein